MFDRSKVVLGGVMFATLSTIVIVHYQQVYDKAEVEMRKGVERDKQRHDTKWWNRLFLKMKMHQTVHQSPS